MQPHMDGFDDIIGFMKYRSTIGKFQNVKESHGQATHNSSLLIVTQHIPTTISLTIAVQAVFPTVLTISHARMINWDEIATNLSYGDPDLSYSRPLTFDLCRQAHIFRAVITSQRQQVSAVCTHLWRAEPPVPHVITDGVGCRHGTGELAGFDDGSSSRLHRLQGGGKW